MSRLNLLLALVVVAELVVGAVLLSRPRPAAPRVPPVPELATADPMIAAPVRQLAANCRTPADWAALGELYLAHGFFPEGEACHRVAAELAPDDSGRAHDWAFALERLGRLEEANATYTRAAELGHPSRAGCWYFVGRNHLRREKPDEARAAFERAGNLPAARYELARLLVRSGHAVDAVPILDRLAAEFPRAIQPPQLRHRIELLAGSPTAASLADRTARATARLPTPFDREYQRLEAAHETTGRGRALREAQSLLAAGNAADADALVREVLAARWEPEAADLLMEVEFVRGRPAEAVRLAREVIDRAGPTPHFLIRLADAEAEAGRHAEAAAAWTRATRMGSATEAKNAHNHLALHYDKVKDDALSRFHHGRAYLGAGEEELVAGRPGDAKTALTRAVEYDPQLAAAWFYLAETHRELGETESARKAYRKCLALDPDFGRALAALELVD